MSVSGVINRHYYRLGNKASGKALNHYAPNGSNVNVFNEDGSKDQVWYLNNNRLYPESNPAKCLDRYYGSNNLNNADVYAPNDDPNQILFFDKKSTTVYGCYYQIKLHNSNYYLTQVGSDVRWTSTPSGDSSLWLLEEVRKVTDIDGCADDYFAVWSGLSNGPFTENNSIKNLYRKCFGNNGTGKKRNYNLYGAIFSDNGNAGLSGKFHPGVDLSAGEGTAVKAPVSGTVVYSDKDYGTVTIETSTAKFLFLHMTGRIERGHVTEGDVIGYVGGIGDNGTKQFLPHLHVEVHSRSAINAPFSYEINSFNKKSGLMPVYNYF